jgi:DNA-binding Lrp family transcriptional regulator
MKSQTYTCLINTSPAIRSCNSLSELDKKLLNNFQHDFPVSSTPYASMALKLGVSEQEVLESLQRLTEVGAVSRVGAVFRPKKIGTSTLATMAVPDEQLEDVAHLVSSYVSVNHNYERNHYYNLWFVLTAPDDEQLEEVLNEIEKTSGRPVIALPMLKDYHIDLGFDLKWGEK